MLPNYDNSTARFAASIGIPQQILPAAAEIEGF
jgi:hypothetical protein